MNQLVWEGDLSRTVQLADRLYLRLGNLEVRDQCNVGFVEGEHSLALIDYPEQHPDHEIIDEAESYLKKPVKTILFTHAHGDHRNGLATLHREDITLVGSSPCIQEIKAQFPNLPQKTVEITKNGSREFDGMIFEFFFPHQLPAHSPWDMKIALPEHDMMFVGDFLVPLNYMYFHSSNLRNWTASLFRMQKTKMYSELVMGHGTVCSKHFCAKAMEYQQKLLQAAEEVKSRNIPCRQPELQQYIETSQDETLASLCAETDSFTVSRQLAELFFSPNQEL